MNLAQKIAAECGASISAPIVDEFFMPLKNHKYIIIDGRSKYECGGYDYFNDVVELILPELRKEGVDIFYFCAENSPKITCDRCFINLNKKQESYLIKKAQLVVGCENYFLHIAAAHNVKNIGLYAVYSAPNTQPYWNKDTQIVLESHRDGNLPTYGTLNESPKTINFISSFEVAGKILDELGVSHQYHKYDLLYIGENYKNKVVEVVPDFTSDAAFLEGRAINLRLDYLNFLSGSVLQYWLSNRKVNIVTDKDIHVSILNQFKKNIVSLSVIVSESISEAFLQQCKKIGLNVKIFCQDPEKLKHYRFKFLNFHVHKDFCEDKKLKNYPKITAISRFSSAKVIFSKGKQYSCRATLLANKPLDKNGEWVIFSEDYERELDFFKIYNKIYNKI